MALRNLISTQPHLLSFRQYGTYSKYSPEKLREKLKRDRFLRVDHAGEVGADRIYAGQMAILGKLIHFAIYLFIYLFFNI